MYNCLIDVPLTGSFVVFNFALFLVYPIAKWFPECVASYDTINEYLSSYNRKTEIMNLNRVKTMKLFEVDKLYVKIHECRE